MHKRIDLTKLGGYPLAQEDLDWMQASYRDAFGQLANLIGDMTIIYGMIEAAGAVTSGWVSIGGEMMPFQAGSIGGGEFMIEELATPLVFQDGNSKDVLFQKVAKFSVGGTYNYSDLVRISTLKTGLVPKGMISMWSGAIVDIPATWALCDGTNGTPNLSGRFIAGYAAADADYNAIGNTGGSKEVTLTANQQGKIVGKATVDDIGGGTATVIAGLNLNNVDIPKNGASNQGGFGSSVNIPLTAATDAHPNRPPYYVLAYIMKL